MNKKLIQPAVFLAGFADLEFEFETLESELEADSGFSITAEIVGNNVLKNLVTIEGPVEYYEESKGQISLQVDGTTFGPDE